MDALTLNGIFRFKSNTIPFFFTVEFEFKINESFQVGTLDFFFFCKLLCFMKYYANIFAYHSQNCGYFVCHITFQPQIFKQFIKTEEFIFISVNVSIVYLIQVKLKVTFDIRYIWRG